MAILTLFLTGGAEAAPKITEFTSGLGTGSNPIGIAAGPDGRLWFADSGGSGSIGRIGTDGSVTKFHNGLPAGSAPFDIALGPDGALWFTDQASTPAIGRINASGTIREFTGVVTPGDTPERIVAGPDGRLWFTERGPAPAIGRISTGGSVQHFFLDSGSAPAGIAAGPDGRLWFADRSGAIGRITTSGEVRNFTGGLNPGSVPNDMAAGSDGALWFTDEGGTSAVGRISTTGQIDEFSSGLNPGSSPVRIAGGSDGALWFTDQGAPAALGRITTAASVDEFSSGLDSGSVPSGIVTGPDGNIWFTDSGSSPAIGRITVPPAVVTLGAAATGATSGAILGIVNGHGQQTTFHVEYGPVGGGLVNTGERGGGNGSGNIHISGPINGLRPSTNYRARLVVTNASGTTTGAFYIFTTAPARDRITRLRVRPRTFVAARRGGPIKPTRRAGATVRYNGTQPALTRFTVLRPAAGRRAGHSCERPTRRNRHRRRCTRWVSAGSFGHADVPGLNGFRFSGRVRHHRLRPGAYRLQAVPTSAGGPGKPVHADFHIKR